MLCNLNILVVRADLREKSRVVGFVCRGIEMDMY